MRQWGIEHVYADQLTFAGHHSEAALLGMFNVSVLHNIVHVAFGVAGIALASTFNNARAYLVGGARSTLSCSSMGSYRSRSTSMNFVPVNNADNWLHLGLGAGMLALGVLLGHRRRIGAPLASSGAAPDAPDPVR